MEVNEMFESMKQQAMTPKKNTGATPTFFAGQQSAEGQPISTLFAGQAENGFYGHMTVEKAIKGHREKIIGTGTKDGLI